MRFGLSILLLLIFLDMRSQSNRWRRITPLQSTCEDVKEILKVDKCKFPISEYTLPDFKVMVTFENETCDTEPRAWRVRKGTVTSLAVSPRHEMLPSELDLDLSKYRKRDDGDIVGVEHYDNEDDGISVELYRGYVLNLFLHPRKSEAALRCQPMK